MYAMSKLRGCPLSFITFKWYYNIKLTNNIIIFLLAKVIIILYRIIIYINIKSPLLHTIRHKNIQIIWKLDPLDIDDEKIVHSIALYNVLSYLIR